MAKPSSQHPVLALVTNAWTLLGVLIFGVSLLMVSVRPELQSRDGREGSAKTLAVTGHALTWSAASVLTYRLIRKTRDSPTESGSRPDDARPLNSPGDRDA